MATNACRIIKKDHYSYRLGNS